MENFLKKNTLTGIVYSFLFIILGIILFMSPITTLKVITYIIETILILIGVITISMYVKVESKSEAFSCGFIQGIVCILLALFLIANPKIIHCVLPIVLGIWMVIGSLEKIQVAIRLSEWQQKTNFVYIAIAIFMFCLGLAVICNPFQAAATMVQILGISIIVYAIFNLIESISVLSVLSKKKQ